VDTYIRSGAYGKLPDLPYVPGKGSIAVVSIHTTIQDMS
jgi:hypothetical protein